MSYQKATEERIREKMEGRGVMEEAILSFLRAYRMVADGSGGEIWESEIESAVGVKDSEELDQREEFEVEELRRTVVIKLNGGLGTSMGLERVKSLLEVRAGVNFLDLMGRQILSLRKGTGAEVQFLLMNSQATSEDTLGYLGERVPELGEAKGLELLQNWAPKLERESLEPVSHPANPDLEWCPPGHGDVYPTLAGSGVLDRLLERGVRYAFISNSDNLGAVLDATLLSYFAKSGAPFLMEVTRRTEVDKKGGHLASRKSDGQLLLREVAQCAAEDLGAFQDIERHRYFNTNNIWVNLEELKRVMSETGGVLELPVIRNAKTVDPRDAGSTPVYQLEQAMGAAIECFAGARAVSVPRSRFAAVKGTGDLLALRSDAYEVGEDGRVQLVAERAGRPPVVKLSEEYKFVDSLEGLGMPSLLEAVELEVSGPVRFADGVKVVGRVAFRNETGEVREVAAGEYRDETVKL